MQNQHDYPLKSYDFKVNSATPFAPSLEYNIVEGFIDDSDGELSKLRKEILEKEKSIIENTHFVSDWGTKLGENSLTSRSSTYNLLNFDNSSLLKESIKTMHGIYLSFNDMKCEDNYYVQCWANVMRKSEKIAPHSHGFNAFSYLSGHICLQVIGTSTHYIQPFTESLWSSENIQNKITVFPSYVKHYTDTVRSNVERITIAFDIITEEAWETDISKNLNGHWIKL